MAREPSIRSASGMDHLRRYNRYQDVEIDAILLPHDEISKFLISLGQEERRWLDRLQSRVGDSVARSNALFWVKVRVQIAHLLPHLLSGGAFSVHHATSEHIMLVKGPGDAPRPSSVPLYGTHYARVECLVIDGDSLLVVEEMVGTASRSRKFVTGSVEAGEYLGAAAEREVMEETGVSARFVGVLGVANRLCTRFGKDEILVGCLLRADPAGQTPRASSSEIKSARWLPFSEFDAECTNYMARNWYDAYGAMHGPLPSRLVPDFRGHGHVMAMYAQK